MVHGVFTGTPIMPVFLQFDLCRPIFRLLLLVNTLADDRWMTGRYAVRDARIE